MTMRSTVRSQHRALSLAGALTLALGLTAIPFTPVGAQAPAKAPGNAKPWVAPRTPEGKPDLQGNWSNETQTPFERLKKGGMTLTEEQATALEKRAQLVEEFRDQPSDPNAPPPPQGGEIALSPPGEQTFVEQIAVAAGGAVGGYNGFWLDPGNKVIRIDGVPRSSIVIDPPDGRIPAMTAAGKQRMAERMAFMKQFGQFDHPEIAIAVRPLPHFIRLERRAADAAELLLQQQLHHRSDEGPRHDHDGNGP